MPTLLKQAPLLVQKLVSKHLDLRIAEADDDSKDHSSKELTGDANEYWFELRFLKPLLPPGEHLRGGVVLVEPVAASLVFVESVFLFEVEENLKDGEQEAVASLLAVTGIEEDGIGEIIELVEQNEVLEPDLLDTSKPCPVRVTKIWT